MPGTAGWILQKFRVSLRKCAVKGYLLLMALDLQSNGPGSTPGAGVGLRRGGAMAGGPELAGAPHLRVLGHLGAN